MITPANQGKECVVKHMLTIEWRIWTSYLRQASARSITICMLLRLISLFQIGCSLLLQAKFAARRWIFVGMVINIFVLLTGYITYIIILNQWTLVVKICQNLSDLKRDVIEDSKDYFRSTSFYYQFTVIHLIQFVIHNYFTNHMSICSYSLLLLTRF